jgi:hypothetical protein
MAQILPKIRIDKKLEIGIAEIEKNRTRPSVQNKARILNIG